MEKGSFGYNIIVIIISIFIVICIRSCSISSNRDKYNMIEIEDGYVYDVDTKIIYREYIDTKYYNTSYSVYLSENGNPYRYNETTKKWEEIIKNKEE